MTDLSINYKNKHIQNKGNYLHDFKGRHKRLSEQYAITIKENTDILDFTRLEYLYSSKGTMNKHGFGESYLQNIYITKDQYVKRMKPSGTENSKELR